MGCCLVRTTLSTQRGAVTTLRTKTGRSHWQPFFISQDQAFLFANLPHTLCLCSRLHLHDLHCWWTSGGLFLPGRKEQDNKSKCPWGPTWTLNATSFLNVETRIKECTGGLSQHMQCTHTCPLKAWMSGAWCLSVLEATLGLIDAEQSTVYSRLTQRRVSPEIHQSIELMDHLTARPGYVFRLHLREAPTHLEMHAACGKEPAGQGIPTPWPSQKRHALRKEQSASRGKHVLMDLG